MSKNIIIQEGGTGKQLTVDKLKTDLVGGGTCLWVQEDEVQLTTKTITENGTYTASNDGYYGYEEVIVNIAGAGTATGTDGDGDEAVAYADPITGELVIDKVPSSIEVTTPPTNPYGIYTDGQAIGTNGMVVKAYLKTGGEYGTVPNEEVTLNPTTAVYDKSTDYGEYTIDNTDVLDHPNAYNLPLVTSGVIGFIRIYDGYRIESEFGGGSKMVLINNGAICFSEGISQAIRTVRIVYDNPETKPSESTYTYAIDTPVQTKSGKTVYYNNNTVTNPSDAESTYGINNVTTGTWSIADVATILFDGEQTGRQGSHQTINVSWPRPLDGKVLETSFEILVGPTPNSSGD